MIEWVCEYDKTAANMGFCASVAEKTKFQLTASQVFSSGWTNIFEL